METSTDNYDPDVPLADVLGRLQGRPAWLTGIGLIEAADQQVAEAVSNGNIPPNPREVQQPSVPRAVEDDDDHDRGPGEEWVPVHSERERFCSD